jgi:aspartate kinase
MEIKVFKFGGASVNSAAGYRNVARILKRYGNGRLMTVISAQGKTTNALEEVLECYLERDPVALISLFGKIRDAHFNILRELFPGQHHPVYGELESLFDQLRGYIRKGHLHDSSEKSYDREYDMIVSHGELFSSCILHNYLNLKGINCRLFDARELISTDDSYRDAAVNWDKTTVNVNKTLLPWISQLNFPGVALTQGFIGSCDSGDYTTLGREGSDYTAAVLAYVLRASEVTIWKDVRGVLNADPKWFRNAKKIEAISYREAIELAWFGASVIHPKTIRPLENAGIRLYVKSFQNPSAPGTLIADLKQWTIRFPVYIRKQNQVLISISPRDFSFIVEENLGQIFSILAKYRVRVNVMQNSAISFSVCVDRNDRVLPGLIEELSWKYEIRYNDDIELFTVRHYTSSSISRLTKGRKILLEQKTRQTVHLIVQ